MLDIEEFKKKLDKKSRLMGIDPGRKRVGIAISDENKIPYMGWQYKENIFWPNEKPSWTAAALIIAADSVLNFTDASDLFLEDQSALY